MWHVAINCTALKLKNNIKRWFPLCPRKAAQRFNTTECCDYISDLVGTVVVWSSVVNEPHFEARTLPEPDISF